MQLSSVFDIMARNARTCPYCELQFTDMLQYNQTFDELNETARTMVLMHFRLEHYEQMHTGQVTEQ